MSLDRQAKRLRLGLVLALVAAVGILLGIKWAGRTSAEASGDARRALFAFLTRQTGQRKFTPAFDFDLPQRLAAARSNANVLDQRTAGVRAAMQRAQEASASSQKQLAALHDETRSLKQATARAREEVSAAERRPKPDAGEITALRATYEKLQQAWAAKGSEFASLEAQLNSSAAGKEAPGAQPPEAEQALKAARQNVRELESELSAQENTFIRASRKRAEEPGSYKALYVLIGEQLSAADRLLADADVERRRFGVNFARESCRHALSDAENPWLAARIAEAYLWPHLELADYSPASKERTQDVLHLCRAAFTRAGESHCIETNYALMIAHAPDRRHADTSRLKLADWLEESGDFVRAVRCLKEIQETNVLLLAGERLARIQPRLPATQ